MLLLFTIGWALSGIARRRELLRLRRLRKQAQQRADHPAAAHHQQQQQQATHQTAQQQAQAQEAAHQAPDLLPGVTVVLPVKHCCEHSADNWRTQLSVQYGEGWRHAQACRSCTWAAVRLRYTSWRCTAPGSTCLLQGRAVAAHGVLCDAACLILLNQIS